MTKYFSIPFATGGDKDVTPDALQPDGSVSYTEGFTPDYALPNTDPDYKPIPRFGWNGLMFDVTEALKQVQERSILTWRNDVEYTAGASVIGSDGFYYKAAQSSGPATAPRDPTTQPAYWHGPSDIRKPPLTVATVAAMKALTGLVDGALIDTVDNVDGDGGGARYEYFSTPPGTQDNVVYHDQTAGGGQFKLKPVNGILNAIVGGVALAPTNSSTAVLACITAANTHGLKLVFPGQAFKFTVVSTVGCEIECLSGFSVEPNATGDVAALRFNGVASSTTYQMTGTVSRNARSVVATVSASDLAAGNLLVLQDDSERASDAAKEINIEVHRVDTVSGATINLQDFVRADKAVTATNIYKITPCQDITIRGWNFEALSGSIANSGLFFDMCENVRIYGVKGRNTASDGVSFRRCYDVAVYDWDMAEPRATTSGQGYGIAFNKGTARIHVGRGVGRGMRHTVDFDSCWDITTDWFDSFDAVFNSVMLAHNGWGGDFQSLKVRARNEAAQAVYVSIPATSGATNYTKSIYNLNIEVDAELPFATGAIGFYSEQPLIDSNIDVKTLHGDGSKPTSFTSNISGVRIPADKSKGTRIKVSSIGAVTPVFRNTASAGFGDATFDVTARNCYHAFYAIDSTEINISRMEVENIHDRVLKYDGTNTLQKIVVGPVSCDTLVATLTSIPPARIHSSGCNGRFGPVTDSSSGAALTLGAGFAITSEQLLRSHDGETILVTAAGAVTSAATAFEEGFYNGQRITLVTDQTANTITIQHSTTVQNDGAASVVLGTAKRSASWEYNTLLSRWYQTA